MNITTEEIIEELEKMAVIDTDSLYSKRVIELVNKLKSGEYVIDTNLLPSEDLIFELQSVGFPDLARRLRRGGFYER